MPYKKNTDLPDNVKGVLPAAAQTIWRSAFNSASEEYDSEDTARKVAWSAVKKSYEKKDGKWVKKMKETAANVETQEAEEIEVQEMWVRYNITSFDELEAQQKAEEKACKVEELASVYKQIINNILFSEDITDKIAAIESVSAEFVNRLKTISTESTMENLSESDASEVQLSEGITFVELQESLEPGTFLTAEVQIIEPGWGNKKDNHYYPAEVLKRDAPKFIGAKMYETDHRASEKSTRSWVSIISDILRFTEEGAPVAQVKVIDRSFAQKLLDLQAAGELEKMECSILASAYGKSDYKDDEREGVLITEFVEVYDVDWVTKAGAGGKVLALQENEENLTMEKDKKDNLSEVEETEEKPVTVREAKEKQPVETPEPEPVEETYMEIADVKEYLAITNLPEVSKKRLLKEKFATRQELIAAVEEETAYVKQLTGSGKVRDLGENQTPEVQTILDPNHEARLRKIKSQEAVKDGYTDIATRYMG